MNSVMLEWIQKQPAIHHLPSVAPLMRPSKDKDLCVACTCILTTFAAQEKVSSNYIRRNSMSSYIPHIRLFGIHLCTYMYTYVAHMKLGASQLAEACIEETLFSGNNLKVNENPASVLTMMLRSPSVG